MPPVGLDLDVDALVVPLPSGADANVPVAVHAVEQPIIFDLDVCPLEPGSSSAFAIDAVDPPLSFDLDIGPRGAEDRVTDHAGVPVEFDLDEPVGSIATPHRHRLPVLPPGIVRHSSAWGAALKTLSMSGEPGGASSSQVRAVANSMADAWDHVPLRHGGVFDRSAFSTARQEEARAHSNTYRPVGVIKTAYQQLGKTVGIKRGKVDVAGSRHLFENLVTTAGIQHQVYHHRSERLAVVLREQSLRKDISGMYFRRHFDGTPLFLRYG